MARARLLSGIAIFALITQVLFSQIGMVLLIASMEPVNVSPGFYKLLDYEPANITIPEAIWPLCCAFTGAAMIFRRKVV